MYWFRFLGKTLLVLLSLGTIALVVLIAINRFDEPLNPSANALLNTPQIKLPPNENAYYFMRGFEAPADRNPQDAGIALERLGRAKYVGDVALGPGEPTDESVILGKRQWFESPLPKLCTLDRPACLDDYLKTAGRIEQWERDYSLYHQRYLMLLGYTGYEDRELYSVDENTPTFGAITLASRLATTRAVLMIAKGHYQEGADRIALDMRFWRQMLDGAQQLVTKMIAASMLEHDARLLNQLLSRYPAFGNNPPEILARAIAPLRATERELCKTAEGEIGFNARFVNMLGKAPWNARKIAPYVPNDSLGIFGPRFAAKFHEWFGKLAFLPNASLNLLLDLQRTQDGVCRAKASEVEQEQHNAETRFTQRLSQRNTGLALLYNTSGKALVANAIPRLTEFQFRLHNLDGLLRATTLHFKLHAARIDPSAIPILIQGAGTNLVDPYTEKPMHWDANLHRLVVSRIGKNNSHQTEYITVSP